MLEIKQSMLEIRQSMFEIKQSILTVWKFQDICITEILHEINFGESRSAKTAVFAILGALDFVILVNFSLQEV